MFKRRAPCAVRGARRLGKRKKNCLGNARHITGLYTLRSLSVAPGSKNRSRAIRPLYGFLIARFWAPAKIIGGKNGLPLFLLIRRPKPHIQPERYAQ